MMIKLLPSLVLLEDDKSCYSTHLKSGKLENICVELTGGRRAVLIYGSQKSERIW